ncbi:MAG: oligosaccharide flippase family protein [Roseburia sp.]|nr:oligosaccharide flippase family protein [Roseburia sp.]
MKEKENGQRSFGRSAVLLAAIGIVAKLIGALYRVPLTNIVGAEGMGLYQMVFPLYTVLLAFCGGGVTSAVSRVCAKYTSRGNDAAALRALKAAFVPLLGVSLASAAAVALLRNVISGIQGNTAASVAYLALSPSLFFASGISVLRGYFQGRAQMLPSGISQLIEQSVKLVLGLYLSRVLLPYGVQYAVAGALCGVSASELIALVYLFIRFLVVKRKRVRYVRVSVAAETASEFAGQPYVSGKELLKELYTFALPVTLGSLVIPITQMIDSALVVNLLMYGGVERGEATALFGLFVGPVGTLINMPSVVVLSIAVAFLPAVTSAVERGASVTSITRDAAKWILLFVIPVTAAFMLFPKTICSALYSRGLSTAQLDIAARLLRVQAISVFYVGILQFATTVLQGHNRAHKPVINLVVGACVKVALTPVLVRTFGIIGVAGATAACYAVAAALSVRCAYKCAPVGADLRKALFVPIIFTALGCGAFIGAYAAIFGAHLPVLWKAAIAAAVFIAVYAVGVTACGSVNVRAFVRAIGAKKRGGKR